MKEGHSPVFSLSPVDRREYALGKWLSFALSVGTLAIALRSSSASSRPGLLLAAVGFTAVAVLFDSAHRRSFRCFEISTEELAEVHGDLRTVLRWADSVQLGDQPWRRRVVLMSANKRTRIAIPYSVVGFERLMALILSHGFDVWTDRQPA